MKKVVRVVVFARSFPAVSETFVLDHAVGMLAAGIDVRVVAICPGTGCISASIEKRFQLSGRVDCVGSRSVLANKAFLKYLWNLLWVVISHPVTVFKLGIGALRNWTPRAFLVGLNLLTHDAVPDVVHCHSGHNARLLTPSILAGIWSGAKWAVTFHGFDYSGHVYKHGSDIFVDVFRFFDRIYACSSFSYRKLRALGAPEDKMRELANGINLSEISKRPQHSPNGRIRLVTVGRLVPVKGHLVGLRVLGRLLSAYDIEVDWHIVGDGPLRDELKRAASAAGLERNVVWHGSLSRDDVLLVVGSADVMLSTGIVDVTGAAEAQGVALMEAMAIGVPVVASDIGGVAQTLGHGYAGVLVPEGDCLAFAHHIFELVTNPELYKKQVDNGRRHVESQFDLESLQHRLIQDYGELVTERRRVRH